VNLVAMRARLVGHDADENRLVGLQRDALRKGRDLAGRHILRFDLHAGERAVLKPDLGELFGMGPVVCDVLLGHRRHEYIDKSAHTDLLCWLL